MVPEISAFPSRRFYQGKLLNDKSVLTRETDRALDNLKNYCPNPFMFLNLRYSKEKQFNTSKVNFDEIEFTFRLVKIILQLCSNEQNNSFVDFKGRIGIVAPYKAQVI